MLAWTLSWFSIILTNVFALEISAKSSIPEKKKEKKKEKRNRLGSDLSYNFLEAEANSADSMVKQFNYLSMLELHSMVKQ